MEGNDDMTRRLEVFFDYACPFCLKGHEYLKELLPNHTNIEVVWRPCEAHPRPERHGPHSDLCIQGLFYTARQGIELWDYHDRMFRAALKDRINIEDPSVLAGCVADLLDASSFCDALQSGAYEMAVSDANDYAYEQSGVWAVPAYRMDGLILDSVEGVGVSKAQLADFLKNSAE